MKPRSSLEVKSMSIWWESILHGWWRQSCVYPGGAHSQIPSYSCSASVPTEVSNIQCTSFSFISNTTCQESRWGQLKDSSEDYLKATSLFNRDQSLMQWKKQSGMPALLTTYTGTAMGRSGNGMPLGKISVISSSNKQKFNTGGMCEWLVEPITPCPWCYEVCTLFRTKVSTSQHGVVAR